MIVDIDAQTIRERVQRAGVVGAGGAGFPTHVKLNAKAEIYLVNGAECEPLLKVDQQLAERQAAALINGLRYAMIATGARRGIIALKAKYQSAIEQLTPLLPTNIELCILPDIYPAGDEVITIRMATGLRVPPGALPLSVGVVVNNVQTLINIANAVERNEAVTQRTLTVNGAVNKPLTVSLPIGTPLSYALELAGGSTEADPVYINGGPMMGFLVNDLSSPITKTTGGLLVLPRRHILVQRRLLQQSAILNMAKTVCEQCSLCTELCPRHLIGHELPPHLIIRGVNYQNVAPSSVLLSALTCSECGVCEAYACPVGISPMRINKALKTQLRSEGVSYKGPLGAEDPMFMQRLVPIKRLISRLELDAFNHKAPFIDVDARPSSVVIPLRQHIGTAAKAIVQPGQRVQLGQTLAEIPDGQLGAPIHASMAGIVTRVNDNDVTLSQEQ